MASEDQAMKAMQVKLVLLGEAAVGKSSLVLRFVSNNFNENTSPTIGAAFLTQKCRLENRIVKFEIWDTAGQERFHSLAPMYYRNAAAAVVVYDITKAASLEKAKAWVKELQRQANPNIVIALVGNKLDLLSGTPDAKLTERPTEADEAAPAREAQTEDVVVEEDDDSTPPPPSASTPAVAAAEYDDLRQVSYAEAEAYAKEANLLFFEASAKEGTNVNELFTEIAKTIPVESPAPKPAAGPAGRERREGRVELEGDGAAPARKGGCC